MKAKRIGLVMAVILVATTLGVFVLPRELKIHRAVLINATPNVIYSYIVDLRRWDEWWATSESTDQATSLSEESRRYWRDNGTLVVTNVKYNKRVDYEIHQADEPGTGNISLTPVDTGTLVTWNHEQTARWSPIHRLRDWSARAECALEIQKGLERLKTRVEHHTPSQPDSP